MDPSTTDSFQRSQKVERKQLIFRKRIVNETRIGMEKGSSTLLGWPTWGTGVCRIPICRTLPEKLRHRRCAKEAKRHPCEELSLPIHQSAAALGEWSEEAPQEAFCGWWSVPCVAPCSGPRPCLATAAVFRIDPWNMWVQHCAKRYENAIKTQ